MSYPEHNPVLAYVWKPEELDLYVLEISRRVGAVALIDLSHLDASDSFATLKRLSDEAPISLKISPSTLMDYRLRDIAASAAIDSLWVELHPWTLPDDPAGYLNRAEELSVDCPVYPILGSIELIRNVLENHPRISDIALKGNEASGFVSSETTFSLFCSVLEMTRKSAFQTGLFTWGGIATAEATAAALCVGARGIVFESLHWLTDRSQVSDRTRQAISGIRLDHTDLIGQHAGIPYRVFNKGNSRAVREADRALGYKCRGKDLSSRRKLARSFEQKSRHALEAEFHADELIPLGVEACFAKSAAARYGPDTERFLVDFSREVNTLCAKAGEKWRSFLTNPHAEALGLRFPFVQGAMTWITDNPDFAVDVADAGALPTLAIGALDKGALQAELGDARGRFGERSYAVNLMALPENNLRDEQLEWLVDSEPPLAVIAGGDLETALTLASSNRTKPVYIAPNPDMVRRAFEKGVAYVVCEGNEAGGHVGKHSLLTFAQAVLELKRGDPSLFEGRSVILAGGVFNGDSAFMAAMLGADLIQLGTAYLATNEIVESGALAKLYQRLILESKPGGSVVSGESLGSAVRSLKTERMERLCDIESDLLATGQDDGEARLQIERLAAMSLFKAARGLDRPGGRPISESDCMREGQFMSGACAGAIQEALTIAELHERLAQGAEYLMRVDPSAIKVGRVDAQAKQPARNGHAYGSARVAGPRRKSSSGSDGIVITGMDMVNSLGVTPEEIWDASLAGRSGVSFVPASKWDHSSYYDPTPLTPEKTYCDCAAFMNVDISRSDIDVPPHDFRTMTEATKLSLLLAKRTLESSGILESDAPRDRIAVIVSQNPGGVSSKSLTDMVVRDSMEEILAAVGKVTPLGPNRREKIRGELLKNRTVLDDTSLLGRLASATAGFVCGKYGFSGPSFSVAAACATSAAALFSAVQMIRNNVIDAALIGGGEALLTGLHFVEFSALGALAGLSGKRWAPEQSSRPFDADRDGMVLGEGGGMIFIERESLAQRRGARILARITGMGAATNNFGMVEPSRDIIERTIRDSMADLEYGPQDIAYIECHATSTQLGDLEEIAGMKSFFGIERPIMLSSFKSQIGHTLGASAICGLIRSVMAMNHGIIPPSINCDTPDRELESNHAKIIVPAAPIQWNERNRAPRRTMVNSFGFGGPSYVTHLEQVMDDSALRMPIAPVVEASGNQLDSKDNSFPRGVFLYRTELERRPFRVAVVAESDGEARSRVQALAPMNSARVVSRSGMKRLAEEGVYLALETSRKPRVAFVFPGQGSQYVGAGRRLSQEYPVIREWIERGSAAAEFDLKAFLFDSPEHELKQAPFLQPSMFALECAIARGLMDLGVVPDALAGHSGGELAALCLAGVFSFEDGVALAMERSKRLQRSAAMKYGPTSMAAIGASREIVEGLIEDFSELRITNVNSPVQTVVGGPVDSMEKLADSLITQGRPIAILNVDHAFHLPMLESESKKLERFLADIEVSAPKIPALSNVTGTAYPDSPGEIRRLIVAQAESPVNWMANVESLVRDHSVNLLVETGPGHVLGNLAEETDRKLEIAATCLKSGEIEAYRGALATLFAKRVLSAKQALWNIPFPGASEPESPTEPQPSKSRSLSANRAAQGDRLGDIVRDEIDSFILETSGRYLMDNILAAARRGYDKHMTMDRLRSELASRYPGLTSGRGEELTDTGRSIQSNHEGHADTSTTEAREDDVTEALIRVIMDCTGYERFEIEPHMDLRRDLAIRSSRLPVILHALEDRFGVKIRLEQFADARTVQEVSDVLGLLVEEKGYPGGVNADVSPKGTAQEDQPGKAKARGSAVIRAVLEEAPVPPNHSKSVELTPGDKIVILNSGEDSATGRTVEQILRDELNAATFSFPYVGSEISKLGPADEVLHSASGLIIALDREIDERLTDIKDVLGLITRVFRRLQAFADSPDKKFCVLVHDSGRFDGWATLVREGLTGAILCAAREFESVRFRIAELSDAHDIRAALDAAITADEFPAETTWRDGTPSEPTLVEAPTEFSGEVESLFEPGDTVVLTGGARGITSHLARALAPFGVNLALLGTTQLVEDPDFLGMLSGAPIDKIDPRSFVKARRPDISDHELRAEAVKLTKSSEIHQTLTDLRAMGVSASYWACDVTDMDDVRRVVASITDASGPIVGVAHGAGIIRDRLLREISETDFTDVAEVKVLGAWNLYRAVDVESLKVFVVLSSIAVWGNPGQAAYSAGNRAMSALIRRLAGERPEIMFKSLTLPPIEGAGMADDAEVRALLTLRGVDYLHAHELEELFIREISASRKDDVIVTFGKRFDSETPASSGDRPKSAEVALAAGPTTLRKSDLPMIEAVESVDLRERRIEALCRYSRDTHLWLEDHTPGQTLKHPFVSGVMALETLMEACRILYPHFVVRAARNVEFLNLMEVPQNVDRDCKVTCWRVGCTRQGVLCKAVLAAPGISPTGRVVGMSSEYYRAEIVLGPSRADLAQRHDKFPLDVKDMEEIGPGDHKHLTWQQIYPGLKGRYDNLCELAAIGEGRVVCRYVCRESEDVLSSTSGAYQYSPYLLEAMLQTGGRYLMMERNSRTHAPIPVSMEEVLFARRLTPGERLIVEASIRGREQDAVVWDARATDADSHTIMSARGLVMKMIPIC